MSALPKFLVPALMGILLLLGLALPSAWAGLLLVGIAMFLAWLTALSWPVTAPVGRAMRICVDLALLGLGLLKLLGRV